MNRNRPSLVAVAAAVALLSLAVGPRASAQPDDALAKTLERQLAAHFDALNEEKLEEAMKLIHRGSPTFNGTRDALQKQFQTYDLKFKISTFAFIGSDGTYAVARVEQETVKIAGPKFQDNIIDTMQVFKKNSSGAWKLWQTAILEIKPLGKPR